MEKLWLIFVSLVQIAFEKQNKNHLWSLKDILLHSAYEFYEYHILLMIDEENIKA